MGAELLIVAAVAFGVAYLIAQRPDLADNILLTREVTFGAIGIIGSIILIGTGSPGLVLLGGLILFLIWLKIIREKPYEGTLDNTF